MTRVRAKPTAMFVLNTIAVLWTVAWAARLVVIWSWSFAPPAARYDAARDLPPLPPPEENGWTVIAAMPEDVLTRDRDWPADDLDGSRTAVPSPAEIERVRPAVEAWTVPEALVAEFDEALARPRFAVDCAPLAPCPVMSWVRATRIAWTLVVKDALAGRYTAAFERLERMLRAGRDAVTHAREVFAGMTAAMMTAQTIQLSVVIATILARDEGVRASPRLLADVSAVERVLATLDPTSWSLETILIGDSLHERALIDVAASGGHGCVRLARTIEASDAYHEAAIAYARDPQHVQPPARVKPGWIWRTLDPVSALAVGAVGKDLTGVIRHFERTRARAVNRIATARVALAEAHARVESAPEAPLP